MKMPIDPWLAEIAQRLMQDRVLVVTAPPGSGKTTRIPPYLLQHAGVGDGAIAMLQPRRIAARATAQFMAQQLGETVGKTIGMQVRFERKSSTATRIMVMTEGILIRRLAHDPFLEGIDLLMLDEFHERSLDSDIALAAAKELLNMRPEFKLLVMSATLDQQSLTSFLGCSAIQCTHAPYPLAIEYRSTHARDAIEDLVAREVLQLPRDRRGVLVFLSGISEIRRCAQKLRTLDIPWEVHTLYGAQANREQDRALAPATTPRLVLATNIAETSLTIPGIDTVIDCGFAKIAFFDQTRGHDALKRQRISLASADQRAGRAARTKPGLAIRLWSENRQATLKPHDLPEIKRLDLTPMILTLVSFHGSDLASFPFFERPDPRHLDAGIKLLHALDALDDSGRLTPLGRKIASFPLHPRLGAMTHAGASAGHAELAAACAAIISESYDQQFTLREAIDRILNGTAPSNQVRAFQQIRKAINIEKTQNENISLGELLLTAFPDRLCRIQNHIATCVLGYQVETSGQTVDSEYAIAVDLKQHQKGIPHALGNR